jgi:micrococcal nuclease
MLLSLCIALSVHDGDSFRCNGERIRLTSVQPVDAPEMPGSPRCRRGGWCDYGLAIRARDRLAGFLRSPDAVMQCEGVDRYQRRLCRVTVNGRDVGQAMQSEGLVRFMSGWR